MGPHGTRPEIMGARSFGSGWALRRSTALSEEMLYVARCSGPAEPTIRLALPTKTVRAVSSGLRSAVAVAAGALGALAVLVGMWLARSVTRPLTDLSRTAQRIAGGENSRAREEGPAEVRAVARSLNAMADALSAAVERERRSGAYLESILAQMADGVLVVTAQETVAYVNQQAAAML
jgi:signal transduction histidine kinase